MREGIHWFLHGTIQRGKKVKPNMDSSIHQFDMFFYDGLLQAFNELNNDITSLCMKQGSQIEITSLSNETELLKIKHEQCKIKKLREKKMKNCKHKSMILLLI